MKEKMILKAPLRIIKTWSGPAVSSFSLLPFQQFRKAWAQCDDVMLNPDLPLFKCFNECKAVLSFSSLWKGKFMLHLKTVCALDFIRDMVAMETGWHK